jgi:hypothetical protein
MWVMRASGKSGDRMHAGEPSGFNGVPPQETTLIKRRTGT